MSRKTKRPLAINAPVTPAPISDRKWLSPAALTLAVLVFYWEPLTSAKVSILWDAADYYWLVQKYFSDELWKGQLPYWTPFVWAGFPFLADPQVGAWYPLNWPFFLSGVSPWTIHAENFLHSLLAALGAYYLSFHLLRSVPSALLTGICYGLSGYFIGHSSHTTMVQAAAWLPWLLLCYLLLDVTRRWFYFFLATLLSGLIIVVGHFQTTLYCFLALGLAAISRIVEQPKDWVRKLLVVFLIPTGGTLLSAVHTLPGLELVVHSVRSTLSAIERTEGFIVPQSLLSLLYADYYGVIRENYRGPTDITQYYFYAGGLLVPLAILGIKDSRLRWLGLLLTLVPLWYAAGHAGGLYQLTLVSGCCVFLQEQGS